MLSSQKVELSILIYPIIYFCLILLNGIGEINDKPFIYSFILVHKQLQYIAAMDTTKTPYVKIQLLKKHFLILQKCFEFVLTKKMAVAVQEAVAAL